MPNGKMDAIQVQDAVVGKQRTLSPRCILLSQRVVQAAHRTSTGCHPHEGGRHLSDFMRAGPDFQTFGSVLRPLLVRSACSARTTGCETPLPDLWGRWYPSYAGWDSV